MRTAGRAVAGLAIAWAVVMALAPAAAADSSASAYRQAVADTLTIVQGASAGDAQAARQADTTLRAGTGQTQAEILADLDRRPPDFTDAAARLRALLDALDNPANTADSAGAQTSLRNILAMHRYDALHRPPSLTDRFVQWAQDQVRRLLAFLFGGNGSGGVIPTWTVYALGTAGFAVVVFVVARSVRGRLSGEYAAAELLGPRAPADFFAEADRLAARGDHRGAIRALCAGVAGSLAGERTWEGSPLTVREIFQRSPDPQELRPLLAPFEAAVYGGRDVDEATYARAAAAAQRFRAPAEEMKVA